MSINASIEAIQNKNSKKIFVLVENHGTKMTIINPDGQVLTVPDGLFDPPFSIDPDKLSNTFTAAQIATIDKQFKKTRTKTTRKRVVKKKVATKSGIGAKWNCSKLTFYKHKIEPLQVTESFEVTTEDGIFTILKSDFTKLFNEVVISSEYWQEGSYTFQDLPEKAKNFIK